MDVKQIAQLLVDIGKLQETLAEKEALLTRLVNKATVAQAEQPPPKPFDPPEPGIEESARNALRRALAEMPPGTQFQRNELRARAEAIMGRKLKEGTFSGTLNRIMDIEKRVKKISRYGKYEVC